MIKSISILTLSVLLLGLLGQASYGDEFDNLEGAQARANQQRRDQDEYSRQLTEISASNRGLLKRMRAYALSKGGAPKNVRCYEGLEFPNFGRTIGAESDYTWQIINGVPVGAAIPHYSAGNVIGAIAFSPFTIANAVHHAGDAEVVHHTYPPMIGLCRFSVNNKYCSIAEYINSGEIAAKCL
jgi:hypothetical protein